MHSILDAAIGYVLGGICVFPTLGVVRDSPGNRQYSHSRRRLKRTAHRTRSPRQESRSQRGDFFALGTAPEAVPIRIFAFCI